MKAKVKITILASAVALMVCAFLILPVLLDSILISAKTLSSKQVSETSYVVLFSRDAGATTDTNYSLSLGKNQDPNKAGIFFSCHGVDEPNAIEYEANREGIVVSYPESIVLDGKLNQVEFDGILVNIVYEPTKAHKK